MQKPLRVMTEAASSPGYPTNTIVQGLPIVKPKHCKSMHLKALSMPRPLCRRQLTKTLRIMKLTAILLLAACLHISARGVGQTLTLHLENAPLQRVFREIERQSGYSFVYGKEQLSRTSAVNISIANADLETVLMLVFKDQPLSYTITGKYIAIRQIPVVPAGDTSHLPHAAATTDVRGMVYDDDEQPLSGANVTVKGTERATVTDNRGEFQLRRVEEGAILIFSNAGMAAVEIKVSGNGNLRVRLKRSINTLDETVVIAYGTTTRRLNTGSVATLKGEDIAKQPVNNPLEALEGRIPGLLIIQNTGVPGGGMNIRLRGQNSIRPDGNALLYIIDGVPVTATSLTSANTSSSILAGGNPLSALNPSDIERIEILKDADATAIYGSRGANGVVLITTKKGNPGKTRVDINFYQGAGGVTKMMSLLSTPDYLKLRHEAFANDNEAPQFYDVDVNGVWDTTRNTDWQKALIGGTSHMTDAQASVSGGSGNTQFLLNGGYHRQSSVFPGNFAYQKGSTHLNVTHTSSNKKFNAIVNESFVAESNNLPSGDLTSTAMQLPPDAPAPYTADGKINFADGTWPLGLSPVYPLAQPYQGNTTNLIADANLSYALLPGLHLRTSLGYTSMTMKETRTFPIASYDPSYTGLTGTARFGNSSIRTWIIEPQADYERNFGNSHLNVLIGATFQQDLQQSQTLEGDGYTSDALLGSIRGASAIIIADAGYAQYKYNALFGRIGYTWSGKFLLNLTGRRDGSSRFGPGRQFANFGAAGAGWIFSEEGFIKNGMPFLSFGKLRASYGITGNDKIGDYGYLSTYSPTSYSYQGGGLLPSRIANPDFSWETNKKLEFGLELGFFKDRILFTGDYYRNRSSNQLVGYSLPAITGFTSIQYNLPAVVQNTGLEFQVNTVNLNRGHFKWTTGLNLTIPSNKLVAYPNIAGSAYANIYTVGQSLRAVKAYHYTGVDPQTGIYQFEDVNKDGMISYPEDLQTRKKITQAFYGGLQNSFTFKGVQLDVFFQFVKQTGGNYLNTGIFSAPGMFGNEPTLVLNGWRHPGDRSSIPIITQDYGSDANSAYSDAVYSSDIGIQDASFIRLKNISLSWDLPAAYAEKMHMQSARIFFQAQNLLTISHYQGLDPESQSLTTIPALRVITAGFKLTL